MGTNYYDPVVQEYDNNVWQPVGGGDVYDETAYSDIYEGTAYSNVSLFVDQNTPYMAYQESDNSVWVSVYNSGSWEPVGRASAGTGISSSSVSLFVDQGAPYVAYQDISGDINVSEYSSGSWGPVGTSAGPGISTSPISLFVDPGTPYVAYKNTGGNATVMYYPPPAPTYTVTFDSNGGSTVTSQSVSYDGTATAPSPPTMTGSTFAGWYTDNTTFNNAFDFTTPITGDITLYAKWTINSYAVNFDSNGGSTVTSQSVSYDGTATAPTSPTMTGYTFAGWYTDNTTFSNAFDFTTPITGDITLYAKWTLVTNKGGGGGGGPAAFSPAVQTVAATGITANSAALNGEIISDDNSNITKYGFLWGTGPQSLTNTLTVGTDNHSGAFTDTLGSLTAGTAYYFQAYAKNAMGESLGAVLSFTAGTLQTPPTQPVFSDVPSSYWAYGAINQLSTAGYVYGYPDGTFGPDSQITRAEFAAIMDKVLNLTTAPAEAGTRQQTPTFTDVNTGDWFYQAVETSVYAGIFKGYGDGTFHPNAPISRQEIACVLIQAMGESQLADSNAHAVTKFLDDHDIAWWSRGYIFVALQQGIVGGYPDNTYQPRNETTRAEACVMVENFLNIHK
jgi:uncharacterized repeat protein (TIGR02543 family)